MIIDKTLDLQMSSSSDVMFKVKYSYVRLMTKASRIYKGS